MNIDFYIPIDELNNRAYANSPNKDTILQNQLTKLSLPANFLNNLLTNRQKKKSQSKVSLNKSNNHYNTNNNSINNYRGSHYSNLSTNITHNNYMRNYSHKNDSNSNKSDMAPNNTTNTYLFTDNIDDKINSTLNSKFLFHKFIKSSHNKRTFDNSETEIDNLRRENDSLKEENKKLKQLINKLTTNRQQQSSNQNANHSVNQKNFESLLVSLSYEKQQNINEHKTIQYSCKNSNLEDDKRNRTIDTLSEINNTYFNNTNDDYTKNQLVQILQKTKNILVSYDKCVKRLTKAANSSINDNNNNNEE